jgi:penicillin-binding protein 1A
MAKQEYITPDKARRAKAAGLGLEPGTKYSEIREPYFFDFVQSELIERYGVNTVRQGGLQVYTTIDPQLQDAAESAIAANPTAGAANALVSTDAETGEILAMASSGGSEAYGSSQFNLAAQGSRQPGSSFKPFVLMTAVDQGIDPDSTYYPAPGSISLDIGALEPWTVVGGGSGSMSLRDATAQSTNVVYAQLGIDVGPDNFTQMAKDMGITSKLEPYAAYALGGTSECCTVLEMSNAYATIANGGVHHDPTGIERVEFPNGDEDVLEDEEGNRVVSDGVAYTVADVMKGTLESGTAAGFGIGCPASGKTGTTEEQSDAWFVGYTPHISTAVWTGNPNARVPLPGYGADLSAPIWQDYMNVAASEPCDDYPEPSQPANLSSYNSENTAGSSTSTDDTSTYDDAAAAPATPAAPTDTDTGGGGAYDPDLYAPGAGQGPAPAPGDN